MDFNVCIIQPANYIHSAAFSELAELVCYGLQDLGHSAQVTVNAASTSQRNIIIGCHLLDPIWAERLAASSIILNTEQIFDDSTAWNQTIIAWARRCEMWDYSHRNIEQLKGYGATNIRYLPLGYHPKLNRIPRHQPKDIDVLFYGSTNERRVRILRAIQESGLNLHHLFGVYGAERDKVIARSKVVLNLHAYEAKIFEVVRVSYLLNNAKATVCEVSPGTVIQEDYARAIVQAPYEGLVEACRALVADPKARAAAEERGLEAVRHLPQGDLMAPLLAG